MKKLLALLVCVAVVAMCFSFAGCKKKDPTPTVPGVNIENAKDDAAAAAKKAEEAAADAAKKADDAAKEVPAVPAN